MRKTQDKSIERTTAKCRSFLLWFAATGLIVSAMAVSPAYAFADDAAEVPDVEPTLYVDQEQQAAPDVVETPAPVAVEEPVALEEPVAGLEEPTTPAEETPAIQQDAPSAQEPSSTDSTSEELDASTETPDQTSESATNEEASTTKDPQLASDSSQQASNDTQDDSTPAVAVQEPASNISTIVETEPVQPAITEPEPQEPIITDAPANAPPDIVADASADEQLDQPTQASSDITQSNTLNVEVASTNGAAASPIVQTQSASTTHKAHASISQASTSAKIHTSDTGNLATQDTYTIRFVLGGFVGDGYDNEVDDPAVHPNPTLDEVFVKDTLADGSSLSDAIQWSQSDYNASPSSFTDSSLTGSWTSVVITMDGEEYLPASLFRLGYNFGGWILLEDESDQTAIYESTPDELSIRGTSTYTLVACWEPIDWFDVFAFVSFTANDSSDYADVKYLHDDGDTVYWDGDNGSTITLPEINTANPYGYNLTAISSANLEFAGYVIVDLNDADPVRIEGPSGSQYYVINDSDDFGAIPVIPAGTYTLGQIHLLGIGTTTFPASRYDTTNVYYPGDLWVGDDMLINPTRVLRAAFRTKEEQKLNYKVTYYNTDASGAQSGAGTQKSYTSATQTAEPYTGSNSLGYSAPTDQNYNFSFKGWATSAADAAAAAGGNTTSRPLVANLGSLEGAWGDNTPADGVNTYTLYAVWEKTAKTYFVQYHDTDGSNVGSKETHELRYKSDSTNDPVKSNTALGLTKANYDFAGWATSQNATTATISAGDPFSTYGTISEGNTVNLYAVWTARAYKVKYNANGGSGTNDNFYNIPLNSSSLANSADGYPAVTRTGYAFKGWSTNSSGSAANKVANSDGTITDATFKASAAGTEHTLYAIWDEITYHIKFMAEWPSSVTVKDTNGTTLVNSMTKDLKYTTGKTTNIASLVSGETTLIPADNRVVVGTTTYEFDGWYVTQGSATSWQNSSTTGSSLASYPKLDNVLSVPGVNLSTTTVANDTITLYGVWHIINALTVSYMPNYPSDPSAAAFRTGQPYPGDNYEIIADKPAEAGYTFLGWSESNTATTATYVAGNFINNIQTSKTLFGVWRPNTVKITLNENAPASGVSITKNYASGQQYVAAKVGDTIVATTSASSSNPLALTIGTPSLQYYKFVGWARANADGSATGLTSANVIIREADTTVSPNVAAQSYTIVGTDAPADDTEIKLVGIWEELTYTVRYHTNVGTDTTNTVTFTDKDTGNPITDLPYVETAFTKRNQTGLQNPNINKVRKWYTWAGWSVDANADYDDATAFVKGDQSLGTLYDSQTNPQGRILNLYAIWKPIEFTVTYEPADTHVTVQPTTEVVNLATGKTSSGGSIQGSTAEAVANSGYRLADRTWRDKNDNDLADQGLVTTVGQGKKLLPTLEYLRGLAGTATNVTNTAATFKAYSVEADWDYQIKVYLENADGLSWNTDIVINQIGTTYLTKKLGVEVKHTDTVVYNGQNVALKDIALKLYKTDGTSISTTSGISNEHLYDFVDSPGTLSFVTQAESRSSLSNNVLELYYKRKTFALDAEFYTKRGTAESEGAPASMTGNTDPDSYVVRTNATENKDDAAQLPKYRWGDSVTINVPSMTGFTFNWAVRSPSASGSATLTGSGSTRTFKLTAAGMDAIYSSANPTAVVKGTFEATAYTVTLHDSDYNRPGENHNWPTSTSEAAQGLASSSHSASTSVYADDSLVDWVPTPGDLPGNDYYFAGWRDDDTNASQDPISSSDLNNLNKDGSNPWTGNKSYTAVWLKKLVVTYSAGDHAAWVGDHASLNIDPNATPPTLIKGSDGDFEHVIGALYLDSVTGNPKGEAGWEFDYWEVTPANGTTGSYGHAAPYGTLPNYLNEDNSQFFKLNTSWTFTAHWKGTEQTVQFTWSGPVKNNTENHDTVVSTAATYSHPDPYVTGEEIDLSNYAPASIPDGYTLAEWAWEYTDGNNVTTTGTYASNQKIKVKVGSMTLSPVFNEKTVTFTYQVADSSAGKGSVYLGTNDPNETDTVYAVKHNGVRTHTATSSNTTGYEFVNWTYNSDEVVAASSAHAASGSITESDMGLTGVLTSNRTYVANFATRKYTVTFEGTGKTDTANGVGTVTAGGTGVGISNDFTVDWNTKIPGTVTVVAPEGYELDGWIVDGAGAPQTFSGDNGNNKGIYNYLVTGNHTLTAHFKVSDDQNYLVNYSFDPAGTSHYTASGPASRRVSWGEDVRPSVVGDKAPTQPGFTFEGWYIDSGYSKKITDSWNSFESVYNQLVANGASSPNLDTTSTPKSITIYAKWTAKTYTVAYDVYGNVANAATAYDDVVVNNANHRLDPKTDITWYDPANLFAPSTDSGLVTRPGYRLSGWSATVPAEGGTKTTSGVNGVVESDTYGSLADNDADNEIVTLHAIWTSNQYMVQYVYNDDFATAPKSPKTVIKGWAEEVDYYSLGDAPAYEGYTFNGWDVSYTGDTGRVDDNGIVVGPVQGTRITAAGNTTMRDIVNGDTTALPSNTTIAVITFTASWTKQSSFHFQDMLVHVDGTQTPGDAGQNNDVPGNTVVVFAERYGAPKTKYDGYDFDDDATADDMTITEGRDVPYPVYYQERSYDIYFYTKSGDTTASNITNGNAWDSAPAQIPDTEPTRAGYVFDGWYLTYDGKEAEIDGTNTLKSLTSVFTDGAPAKGTRLEAYGHWTEIQATIAWEVAIDGGTAHGTVDQPSSGSTSGQVQRWAVREAGVAIPAITATPDGSGDYEFDKWTYAYTDAAGVEHTGDVDSSSKFATLSGTDNSTLTPIPWTTDGLWHNITFTANFALSSLQKVTIKYYLQDGDDRSSYPWKEDETKRVEVVDGQEVTVTPKSFAGYSLNSGRSDLTHQYVFETESTHIFEAYFDALPHNVVYKYVETDGSDQTPPENATLLSSFNNGTVYTGQTYSVSAAPTLTGWTFSGWYLASEYDGTVRSGTSMTIDEATLGAALLAENSTIELVGTWKRAEHSVNFINSQEGTSLNMDVNQKQGGYKVLHGAKVKTASTPVATSLDAAYGSGGLGVTWNNNGRHYTLTGWDVLIDGVKQGNTLGADDVLNYEVNSDVDFRAVWSETFRVTYQRGLHGDFVDLSDPTKSYVESPQLHAGDPMYAYNGTPASASDPTKPKAADGWEFVGWGSKDGGVWTYYFAYNAADEVDYSAASAHTAENTAASLPATVTANIDFIGFYKPLARQIKFSLYDYDSTVAVGTESSKLFADNPQPTFDDATTTVSVKTGKNATMLEADKVVRDGYTLIGWTDGRGTYAPGSTDKFVMPDVPDTVTYYYLYPVFSFDQISITYDVATDSTGRGDVSNGTDSKSNATDTIVGSAPINKPGYEFDYWTKDDGTTALTSTDGLQSDDKTLIPSESGVYHAHFKYKDYYFAYANNPSPIDEQETLPAALPTTAQHWDGSITLGTPTRDGYTFKGWDVYETSDWASNNLSGTILHSKVAAGNVAVSALSDANGNATSLTLVPVWEARAYKVFFNDGKTTGTGAVSGMPSDRTTGLEFASNDIDATAPTRVGYEFAGWLNSVKNTVITPEDLAAVSSTLTYSNLVNGENDDEVTLTAQWTPSSHTLTYDKVGGTWSTTADDYPANDPMKTGATADPTEAIATATDAEINLRLAASISLTGKVLVGWNDGTRDYLFEVDGNTFTMPDGDVTLTPVWGEPENYNVLFSPGDGVTDAAGMPSNRQNIKFSVVNINASAPVRSGWTFTGWKNSVDNSVITPEDLAAVSSILTYAGLTGNDDTIETVTLTAQWSENSNYSVEFDENAEGETVTQMPTSPQDTLKWGDTVYTKAVVDGSPVSPQRAGYVFSSWSVYGTDAEGNATGEPIIASFTGATSAFKDLALTDGTSTRKLVLKANWSKKEYKVVFVENKPSKALGTVTGMPTTNPIDNLKYTATGIVLPTLALSGYQFQGWMNDAKGGNVDIAGTYDFSSLANGSDENLVVTLTAKWQANPHSVTYTIGAGDTWSTHAADYPTSEPAENGATDPEAPIATETDATIDLRRAVSVVHPGSELLGWNDGSRNYLFANSEYTLVVPNGDVTLTPIWNELMEYAVSYLAGDSDGATKVVSTTMPSNLTGIAYAKNDVSTAAPTRPGYTFDGWANDVGADVAKETTTIAYATLVGDDASKKTVTLTAKWVKNEIYKVTYKDGVPAGSPSFSGTLPTGGTSYAFDDAVKRTELNADGTERVGFRFTGWRVTNDNDNNALIKEIKSGFATDELYSSIVSGDDAITAITLTAMWEGRPYNLKYTLTDGDWITSAIPAYDNGADNPGANIQYSVEAEVTPRGDDTVKRDGYVLIGWTDASGAEHKFENEGGKFNMPANDVELFPMWDAKIFHVTFVGKEYGDSGATPVNNLVSGDPAGYKYDDPVTHTSPTRSGYTFSGWYVYDAAAYAANPATAPKLYNTAVGTGESPYKVLAKSADIDAITMVATWTAGNNGVTYSLSKPELTARPQWESANIKDSGKNSPSLAVGYATDSTVNLREADTVKLNGWKLIGWSLTDSPTATTFDYPFDENGHASLTMPAENVVLYSVWERKTYSVEFDGNSPANNPANAAYIVDGATVLHVPDPVNDVEWDGIAGNVPMGVPTFAGWTFNGWEVYGTDADGNITGSRIGSLRLDQSATFSSLAQTDIPEHEHLVLKANWTVSQVYNVVFKNGVKTGETPVNTGTMPSDQMGITYVTDVDHHAPSRVGYKFLGWQVVDVTDSMDNVDLDYIDMTVNGAPTSTQYHVLAKDVDYPTRKTLELTAMWEVKTGYKVHFVAKPEDDQGGTEVVWGAELEPYIHAYDGVNGIAWDDMVVFYPAPTRAGYDFDKWAITDTTDPDNATNIGEVSAGRTPYSKLARGRTNDQITDITLTATWKAHEWSVTYVKEAAEGTGTWNRSEITDSGKNTPDEPIKKVKVDTKFKLREAATLTLAGYELVGWDGRWTDSLGEEHTFTKKFSDFGEDEDPFFEMPDGNVTLYPHWEAKKYLITFSDGKPDGANDPSQVVEGLPPTQWLPADGDYPLTWVSEVNLQHPTLTGYVFLGWVIDNASETGALTGVLDGTEKTYYYKDLALTDTAAHATLNLTAQWQEAGYRLTYADRFDASGAPIATPVSIATFDNASWNGLVLDDDVDPWTVARRANGEYNGKSSDSWHFDGWSVLDVATGTYIPLKSIADDHLYSVLARYEDLTVGDVATVDATPALVLYANWTRRVEFDVIYVKHNDDGTEVDYETQTPPFTGLDGQNIASTVVEINGENTTWYDYLLTEVGPNHVVPGYGFSYGLSVPNVKGTLDSAGDRLQIRLIYTQLSDYTIVHDATPDVEGFKGDAAAYKKEIEDLGWSSDGADFTPNSDEWAYRGYRIDYWWYAPNDEFGAEGMVQFQPENLTGTTYGAIAQVIYATISNGVGHPEDDDYLPVTLHAHWVEKTDYKVEFNDNYVYDDGKGKINSGIVREDDLDRVKDATYVPGPKDNVSWTATNIEPTDTDEIVRPGIGDKELYNLVGWNYVDKNGVQQDAAGKSFAEIVEDMFADETDPETITLYARYEQKKVKLTYTPVLTDEEGNKLSGSNSVLADVKLVRYEEEIPVATGTADGSDVDMLTIPLGYHFIGWRRVGSDEIIPALALKRESHTATDSAWAAAADGTAGYNSIGLLNATGLSVAMNGEDGYWHDEEYEALFAANEKGVLHYSKNADDATGEIGDVEKLAEQLVDLSDGSAFKRQYWELTGWNTAFDGSGDSYPLSYKNWTMLPGETTMYAQWKRTSATLEYAPGGDDVTGIPESITTEWGTTLKVGDQPKREHYTFVGWNTKEDGTGTTYKPGDDIVLPGAGTKLYAQWKLNEYPVTIKPVDGEGGTITYPEGEDGTIDVEHGGYLPSGYVTPKASDGYTFDHYHVVVTDENGIKTEFDVTDLSTLQITGETEITPVFVKSQNPTTNPLAAATQATPASEGQAQGASSGLPQTGDDLVTIAIIVGVIALLAVIIMVVALVLRRRRDD